VKDKPQPSQEKMASQKEANIISKPQKLYTAPLLHNYRPKVEHLQAHHCWYMISAYVAKD
jgi:hypothetical protein